MSNLKQAPTNNRKDFTSEIKIYVSQNQKREWIERASNLNISISQFIRQVMDGFIYNRISENNTMGLSVDLEGMKNQLLQPIMTILNEKFEDQKGRWDEQIANINYVSKQLAKESKANKSLDSRILSELSEKPLDLDQISDLVTEPSNKVIEQLTLLKQQGKVNQNKQLGWYLE
jgi:hypothetical protein